VNFELTNEQPTDDHHDSFMILILLLAHLIIPTLNIIEIDSNRRSNLSSSRMKLSIKTNHLMVTAIILLLTTYTNAVTPSAVIELYSASKNLEPMYASIAYFGQPLPFGKPSTYQEASYPLPIKLAPETNPLLCETPPMFGSSPDIIILAPRGECSFELKTRNAELLGARHVIIYDNLAERYGSKNDVTPQVLDDVIWPNKTIDYECRNGRARIPMNELSFDNLPYDSSNDALLSGSEKDGNLCALYHNVEDSLESSEKKRTFENICPSQRCLMTNRRDVDSSYQNLMEACCAWDMYLDMGGDEEEEINDVNITATFLTMEEGDNLSRILTGGGGGSEQITAIVYLRWYPKINFSSFLLCILGTFVTWLAGWKSAEPYRRAKKILETADIASDSNNPESPPSYITSSGTDVNGVHDLSLDVTHNGQRVANDNDPVREVEMTTIPSNVDATTNAPEQTLPTNIQGREEGPPNFQQETQQQEPRAEADVVNLKAHHAIMFLFAASSMLLILFYTKLYQVVRVLYVCGGCASIAQLIIHPVLYFISNRLSVLGLSRQPLCRSDVNLLDILSSLAAILIGAIWLWLSFTRNNVQSHPFYWIVQDLMGACVCIVFLGLVRLNSVKVATLLLVAAFIYDIFFVFLTPYIFGESVMMTVATGGGAVEDPLHCEKYPLDSKCDNTPLPMLFAIPRINDYRGGFSMLGLGDIVLPGLLCCFAARLDASKSLVKILKARQRAVRRGLRDFRERLPAKKGVCVRFFSGYFYQIIIAYAIGLLLANLAVYLMQRGQPALMYIVPLTLCALVVRGKINDQLSSLWRGPGRLIHSDQVISIIASEGVERVDALDIDSDGARDPDDESFTSFESVEEEDKPLPENNNPHQEGMNQVV